ncbi:MAG TPA: glycosyltransferase family 4 protein [Bacteroidota bacterium]|nr:glycosyltransferase family 4 protein [Bacteroidota bacterium]
MKILLVHNFYGSSAPSGENTAYTAEAAMLRSQGHSVVEFTRHSDEVRSKGLFGTVKGAASTVWNPFSVHALKRKMRETQPDVVHIHNTFPLLSPSIFYASRELNIPTVFTMHNYRIGCSAATVLRSDRPCLLCLDQRSVMPALRYGCYRESRLATLPVATMIALHNAKDSWRRNVDAFITLTEFQREKMAGFGIPSNSLFVKPHFLQDPPEPVHWDLREQKAVFIGRLYAAKGIHVLVDAWKRWGKDAPRLEIIGDGPMKEELCRTVDGSEAAGAITFAGNVSRDEVLRRLSKAKLLILPSLCFEGFPMVIQEAFALGVPVAASNIGSLPYLVDDKKSGGLFPAGNADEIRTRVRTMFADDNALRAMGERARHEFDEKYTATKNHATLMSIYATAVAHRAASQH